MFINVIFLFYYLHIRGKKIQKETSIFLVIFFAILLKDIIFIFLPIALLPLILDIFIIAVYLYWLRLYTGKKSSDNFLFVINALFIIFIILNEIFFFLKDFNNNYFRVFILFDIIYLVFQLYRVSEYNTKNADFIMANRKVFSYLIIIYNVLILGFGNLHEISEFFIFPLSYFIHLYMLHQYNKLEIYESTDKLKFLSQDFESLYDFMKKIGDAIAENLEISNVLEYIIKSTVNITNSDAGVILLKDEYNDILKVKATFGNFPPPYDVGYNVKVRINTLNQFFKTTPIKIGETILGEAAQTKKPILINNTFADDRMEQNTKDDTLFISSIIVAPLIIQSKLIGIISIVRKDKNKPFSDSDFLHAKTFAEYTSISLNNLFTYMELLEKKELERDIGIAANIQAKLLPDKLPQLRNIGISTFSLPAKGVSGDYYDAFVLKNGKIAVIICDVAGKGVPASLVMVMIRTVLHLIASSANSAAKIVNWINKGIYNQIELGHYATLSFLTFDPTTNEIEYSNAGHHPLLLYRKSTNKIIKIDTHGIPVGVEFSSKYHQKSFTIEKGDILLLYTDGIIEAWNDDKEEYGIKSLLNILKEKSQMSADELSKVIIDDVNDFVGRAGQHDDQTLLILKSK